MDEKMHQLGSILAPTILRSRVRIPSTPSTLFQFYTVELLYQCLLLLEREKDENKQKDSGIDPFFTKNLGLFNKTSCTWVPKSLLEQSTWKTHWNDFLWRWQRRKTINMYRICTKVWKFLYVWKDCFDFWKILRFPTSLQKHIFKSFWNTGGDQQRAETNDSVWKRIKAY